jgi:hypothetical protein
VAILLQSDADGRRDGPTRDGGVTAKALGVPRSALLEPRAVAQPNALAVIGLDAAHASPLDVDRAHLGGSGRPSHVSGLHVPEDIEPEMKTSVE